MPRQTEAEKANDSPDSQAILQRIEAARAVYELFSVSKPQLDKEDSVEYESGLFFYRVTDPNLNTMEKMQAFVGTYFSEEITQRLLNIGMYAEIDGSLYAVDVGMQPHTVSGSPQVEVTEKTKTSETYRLTFSENPDRAYQFVYAQAEDGKWVFTQFELY